MSHQPWVGHKSNHFTDRRGLSQWDENSFTYDWWDLKLTGGSKHTDSIRRKILENNNPLDTSIYPSYV